MVMKKMHFPRWIEGGRWPRAIALTVALWAIGSTQAVSAAQRIVLLYGPMRAPISVAELSDFARTGELSPALSGYLGLANQEPEKVREHLTKSVQVKAVLLDRVLNHQLGERLLRQVGRGLRTPSGERNEQALRAALVLSASDDDEIHLMEILENYPAESLEVDLAEMSRLYRKLQFLERLNL
ncbi:MAG: alpha/beta hydrolase [Cyanobacteria bacterium J007]|nr:MAG: alpha/beta hydrolase [Cyanobacteria bacterium J007]